MENKGKKIYFDAAYVGNLIKKFKKKNKVINITLIVLVLMVLSISAYSFFNVVKINRYERYINNKIDLTMDNILKDSVKIKYLLNLIIKGETGFTDYVNLMSAIKDSENAYRDIASILSVALEDVSPNKMVNFSFDFYNFVKNIVEKNSKSITLVLTNFETETFKNYQKFYNDVLFIQAGLLFKVSKSKADNLDLFELDTKDLNSLEMSFQSKYNNDIKYGIKNDSWITMLAKLESNSVQNKFVS